MAKELNERIISDPAIEAIRRNPERTLEENVMMYEHKNKLFKEFLDKNKSEGKSWFSSVTIVSAIDPNLGDANSFLNREEALRSMQERIGNRFRLEIDYDHVFDWQDGEVKPGAEAIIPHTNQIDRGTIWGRYIEPVTKIDDQI